MRIEHSEEDFAFLATSLLTRGSSFGAISTYLISSTNVSCFNDGIRMRSAIRSTRTSSRSIRAGSWWSIRRGIIGLHIGILGGVRGGILAHDLGSLGICSSLDIHGWMRIYNVCVWI